jgi:hypothetical protein
VSIINAKDALLTRLVAMSPVWPTQYENIEFDPTPETSWRRAVMIFDGPTPMGAGAETVEEWLGIMQVSLFVPRGESADPALVHAELIRAHFPRSLCLTDDGFSVTITGCKIHTGMLEPQWYHLPLSIDWQAYSFSSLPS